MRTGAVLLLVAVSTSPGCCTLARLFCGPDTTPWVQQRFDAPERTVATLLEAIRRDQPQVVYLCLSERYRRRLQLDAQMAQLAWQRVREQNPGLHLAGYAEIPAPERIADDGATFVLDVEGTRLRVDLVRQAYWEVVYRRPARPRPGEPAPAVPWTLAEQGAPIASWNTFARVAAVAADDDAADRSRLTVTLEFEHDGLDAVPLDRIESAALLRRWKVDDLRLLPDG